LSIVQKIHFIQPTKKVCQRPMLRLAHFLTFFALLWMCGIAIGNTPMSARLSGLAKAVDSALANTPDTQLYVRENRRVHWIYLPGDSLPDAIVLSRPNKDDCAVNAVRKRQLCKGYVLQGKADGSFTAIADFDFYVQGLGVVREQGFTTALLYSRSISSESTFAALVFNGERFVSSDREVLLNEARQVASQFIDDRNMASLADQEFIARLGSERPPSLAPSRLLYDAVNAQRMKGFNGANRVVMGVSSQLGEQFRVVLAKDLELIARVIPWGQSLEARLLLCTDWMVPRKFWEAEGRRLSSIGVCIDGVVWGMANRFIPDQKDALQMLRYRLLQEVGAAYLLRVDDAPLTTKSLRSSNDSAFAAMATIVGVSIGIKSGLLTQAEALRANKRWQQLAEEWFKRIEVIDAGYLLPTPELCRFFGLLGSAEKGLACMPKWQSSPTRPTPTLPNCPEVVAAEVDEAVKTINRRGKP
jgi:hypothetical protein